MSMSTSTGAVVSSISGRPSTDGPEAMLSNVTLSRWAIAIVSGPSGKPDGTTWRSVVQRPSSWNERMKSPVRCVGGRSIGFASLPLNAQIQRPAQRVRCNASSGSLHLQPECLPTSMQGDDLAWPATYVSHRSGRSCRRTRPRTPRHHRGSQPRPRPLRMSALERACPPAPLPFESSMCVIMDVSPREYENVVNRGKSSPVRMIQPTVPSLDRPQWQSNSRQYRSPNS